MKLGGDMAANSDAFNKLGDDFLKLVGNADYPSPLDLAYKELGGELNVRSDPQFWRSVGGFPQSRAGPCKSAVAWTEISRLLTAL